MKFRKTLICGRAALGVIAKFAVSGVLALSLASVAVSASAGTFIGHQLISGADVNYSISTDGALGVLTSANITAYSVSVTGLSGGFSFSGTTGAEILGSSLVATPGALLFDYSPPQGPGPFDAARQAVFRGNSDRFLAFSSSGRTPLFSMPGRITIVAATDDNFRSTEEAGNQVIAGAVPEPATWIEMILGLGAVGFTMRRRRLVAG